MIEISDISEVLFKYAFMVPQYHWQESRVYLRWSDGKVWDPAYFESLALFLLYEKYFNPQSEWKPWLGRMKNDHCNFWSGADILPEPEEMNNILFWKYTEMKELKGSPVYSMHKLNSEFTLLLRKSNG